jgi:hypothetical protein
MGDDLVALIGIGMRETLLEHEGITPLQKTEGAATSVPGSS